MPLASLRAFATLGLLIVVGSTGCAPDPEVRTYFVPREEDSQPFKPVPDAAEAKYRMLAAVIPINEKRNWFIRCDGPIEQISAVEADFDAFLNSIRSTGKPVPPLSWTVPAGWRVGGPRQMRLVTLQKGEGKKPLEMYISEPMMGSLVDNVNRWRTDFVGIKPWTEEEMATGMKTIQLGTSVAYRFDFVGPGGAKAGGGPARPVGSTN